MRIGSVILTILFVLLIMVGCGSSKQQENVEESITVDSTEASTQPATEAAKEYYGVDLVNKPLSEIIEIMGGDFQTEYSGEHLIYYTSGGFCIFNNDTLPGFAFFINPAEGYSYEDLADPMTDLSGAKQDVLDGKYDSIGFMGVYDSAKYNDKISADMTYLEVSETIGSYEVLPPVGAVYLQQSIDFNATVFYNNDHELNKESAKAENPGIKGIAVFPTNQSKETESPKNDDSINSIVSNERPTEVEDVDPMDKPNENSSVTFDITEADVEVGTAIYVTCTSGHNLDNGTLKTSAGVFSKCFKVNILTNKFDIIANQAGSETFTFTADNGDVGSFTLNAV